MFINANKLILISLLLFCKILRLSRGASNRTASGQVVNLLSNDVSRFDTIGTFLHYIWIMPIQGGLVTYLIWQSVGIAVLAGVFLITIQTIPLQGQFLKLEEIHFKTRLRKFSLNLALFLINIISFYRHSVSAALFII